MAEVVTITESASQQVRSEMEVEGDNLRLRVAGGGCSGMSYELFGEGPDELNEMVDHVQDFNEFKVVIDSKSLIYLKGITLDFEGGLQGKGFQFINPNATSTCGCGESFSTI